MTRAPQSARCRLASGAAIACSSETTVVPDRGNGWLMLISVPILSSPLVRKLRMLFQYIIADRFGLDGAEQCLCRREIAGFDAQLDDLAHRGIAQQFVGNLHGDFHRRPRCALVTFDFGLDLLVGAIGGRA